MMGDYKLEEHGIQIQTDMQPSGINDKLLKPRTEDAG
jgi:hypothetical protein